MHPIICAPLFLAVFLSLVAAESGKVTANETAHIVSVRVVNITENSVEFVVLTRNDSDSFYIRYKEKLDKGESYVQIKKGEKAVVKDLVQSGLYEFKFQIQPPFKVKCFNATPYYVTLMPGVTDLIFRKTRETMKEYELSEYKGGTINNPGSENMYVTFGDSSASNLLQNVRNEGSGAIYMDYGDCSAAAISHFVYNYGSGDIYLKFGSISAPSAGVSSNANYATEWPENVNNQGSGDLIIKYGDITASRSSGVTNVYSRGSGDIRISYESYSTSSVIRKIINPGSGDVHIICANPDEDMVESVSNTGSGHVYVECGNQGDPRKRSPRRK